MTTSCPVCDAACPAPFLCRPDVPVHQNLPASSAAAARDMPRGRLEMVACPGCGFVFNRAFDAALPSYGPGYDNSQGLSPAFARHLDVLARELVVSRGVRGARIVEVGCGQGDFLRRLVLWPRAGNSGVGFDPAYRGPEEAGDGRLRFRPRLYGPDCADTPADVVVCRHVIEHVPDPLALLRAIRAALTATPAARLFLETPDVAWTLRHRVLWDFFYEHCSLFTASALASACRRAGFSVTAAGRVFGGQYLWLEATPGTPPAADDAEDTPTLADCCGDAEAALPPWWRNLRGHLGEGRLALWGAGAKGATLASLIDPAAHEIDCLVDINPAKQGRYVPGTGHAIVAPQALAARGVRHVVAMNPAYRREIAAQLPAGVRLAEWAD
jgi:SAM-dependent methyltransferase